MTLLVGWSLLTVVAASEIYLHTPAGYNLRRLSPDLIDLRCHPYMRFQIKATGGARIALATYNSSTDPIVQVVFGAVLNSKTMMTKGGILEQHFEPALNESEYRPFWISWAGGVISVGRGVQVGNDQILSWTETPPYVVNYVKFSSAGDVETDWIFESPCGERLAFELVRYNYVYNPDPKVMSQLELSPSRQDCAAVCFYLSWCKGFSYKASQQHCRMFDTAPLELELTLDPDWDTWASCPQL